MKRNSALKAGSAKTRERKLSVEEKRRFNRLIERAVQANPGLAALGGAETREAAVDALKRVRAEESVWMEREFTEGDVHMGHRHEAIITDVRSLERDLSQKKRRFWPFG